MNQSFPEALAAFQKVLDKYPQSRKVPDALLKVGFCDYELKKFQAAKDVLAAGPDDVRGYRGGPSGAAASGEDGGREAMRSAERH